MPTSTVTLIDHMGSDDRTVDAARVSMDRRAGEFPPERNARLIAYLAQHGHESPFFHSAATLLVEAPIFVARQLAKHQVGLAWNEVSRRYVDAAPAFADGMVWRGRAENVKQGSAGPLPLHKQTECNSAYDRLCEQSGVAYRDLLALGVAPEQARAVLPLATLTSWYWTGSLAAFARVCRLRLAPDAQQETREVAEQIAALLQPLWPRSWAALMEEPR